MTIKWELKIHWIPPEYWQDAEPCCHLPCAVVCASGSSRGQGEGPCQGAARCESFMPGNLAGRDIAWDNAEPFPLLHLGPRQAQYCSLFHSIVVVGWSSS